MENIGNYLQLGFTHVIPSGFDHILFILCLFFYSSNLKKVLLQCTIFTIAHSIALALSASGIVLYNSKIIEPLIALTILYTAIENIFFTEKSKIRYPLIFIFGLIGLILLAYFLISKWFAHKIWYKNRIVYPISCFIGCIALYWTIERILIL